MPKSGKISRDPAYARSPVADGLLPLLEKAALDPAFYSKVEAYMREHDGEAAKALEAILNYGAGRKVVGSIPVETLDEWTRAAEGTLRPKVEESRRLLRTDLLRPYEPEVVVIEGDTSDLFANKSEAAYMPGGSATDSRRAIFVFTDSNSPEKNGNMVRTLKGTTVEDFVNALEWGEIGIGYLKSLENHN